MTSDAELLRSTAAGDRAAFEELVVRHEAAVFRFIRSLGEGDAAEDALQETFLAAWRGAARFQGTGPARGWLLTIARHAVHRLHRRRVGEPQDLEPLDELGRRAGWASAGGDLPARLASRELVQRALAALSPEDREILLLRDLEGLANDEAGRVLGLELAAVKSRLHRARLRFLAALRRIDDA